MDRRASSQEDLVAFRLPKVLNKALWDRAKRNNRSKSGELRAIVEAALRSQGE